VSLGGEGCGNVSESWERRKEKRDVHLRMGLRHRCLLVGLVVDSYWRKLLIKTLNIFGRKNSNSNFRAWVIQNRTRFQNSGHLRNIYRLMSCGTNVSCKPENLFLMLTWG